MKWAMLWSSVVVVVEVWMLVVVLDGVLGTETGVMIVPGAMWMFSERARAWYFAR